jgi:hypothetical protein
MFHVKHIKKLESAKMDTKQPSYLIKVFAMLDISEISPFQLQADLLSSSFQTLCQQYGLDKRQIERTTQNLEVMLAQAGISPFFLVKYKPSGADPIVVYHWRSSSEEGKSILTKASNAFYDENLKEKLSRCRSIYHISLQQSQLMDMGLLLGYEIARWIGFHGEGLVRDLHGDWYTLNKHQAFIPVLSQE